MTTTLAPGSVTEVLEAHEFAPACEVPSGCSQPAQIILFYACTGGCTDQVCMPHRDEGYRNITSAIGHATFSCKECGYKYGAITSWSELVIREVPL